MPPTKTLRVEPVIYRDPGFRITTSCTEPGFIAKSGPRNNHTVKDFEALDQTQPHIHWKAHNPSFLIEPQDVVGIRQRMRPIVVTLDGVCNEDADPGSRAVYDRPFHAAIEIWYDGRQKQLMQPTRVVRQMPHWTRASRADDGTERVLFLFDEVWVDKPGKFTFRVNIYLPTSDLDKKPWCRTLFSPRVTVTKDKVRMEKGPTEATEFEKLVCEKLAISHEAPEVVPFLAFWDEILDACDNSEVLLS
ncbi:uncharacterized protein C8A04DRAFT_32725 [Dichotomopilus funicola]|uniref:Uncharacterized protein n=1 Tax=Dichotomopilus funicola TaxID=1934379 RepID=A0AAN6ZJJ9_9PEZI|nr:hypothetical protein C8A04DRAFT_32725 [Dichotomopilus funicola]